MRNWILATIVFLFNVGIISDVGAQARTAPKSIPVIPLPVSQDIKNDSTVFINQLASGVVYYIKSYNGEKKTSENTSDIFATLAINTFDEKITSPEDSARISSDPTLSQLPFKLRLSSVRQKTINVSIKADSGDKDQLFRALRDSLDEYLSNEKQGSKSCVAVTAVGPFPQKDIELWINASFHDISGLSTDCLTNRTKYIKKVADELLRQEQRHSDTIGTLLSCEIIDSSKTLLLKYSSYTPLEYNPAYRFVWDNYNKVFFNILGQRIGELRSRSDSVIVQTFAATEAYPPHLGFGDLYPPRRSHIHVTFSRGPVDSALRLLANEIGQVLVYGFTDEEIILWREMLISQNQPQQTVTFQDMAIMSNSYANHFLFGDMYLSTENKKKWMLDMADSLNAKTMKAFAQFWFKHHLPTISIATKSYDDLFITKNVKVDSLTYQPGTQSIKHLRDIYTNALNRPLAPVQPDQNFRIVDLDYIENLDFEERLQIEIDKADKMGYTPVIEFGAIWCIPCRLVDVSLKHPAMRDAFDKIYLIRVDIDVWEEQLKDAAFPIKSLPAFFATGIKGNPTGAVKYGANANEDELSIMMGTLNDNFAKSAAPGFKDFFAKSKEEFLASKREKKKEH